MKLLSIGALSRATRVPVETLRTWERRYGFPSPVRLPSGHRRYEPATVERLQLVQRALDAGHRPAEVVAAPPDELRSITGVGASSSTSAAPRIPARPADPVAIVGRWIDAVRGLRADQLEDHFRVAWDRHGARSFVEDLCVAFLRRLGDLWADGDLTIAHEHFATEHLRDFLAGHWRRLSDAARGGLVVCAVMPGEQHTIGLHLAAVLLGLHGRRVALLGANTPPQELVRAADVARARAVLIATSVVAPATFEDDVREVAAGLGGRIAVLVGGPLPEEALAGTAGLVRLSELADLGAWCRSTSATP